MEKKNSYPPLTIEELGRKKILLYLSGEITVTPNGRHKYNAPVSSSKNRRGYHITKSTRRKLIASAFLLHTKKQYNVIFPTLTFPEPVDGKVNPMLNKFLSNFRKNYGLRNYLWVREHTKAGRPHFHLLAEFPYVDIKKLNKAWCAAIGMDSKNAVRLPPGHRSVVKDIKGVCCYLTKYISKTQGAYYPERCYGISSSIVPRAARLDIGDFLMIQEDFTGNVFKNEYVEVWNIHDFFKKPEYFYPYIEE